VEQNHRVPTARVTVRVQARAPRDEIALVRDGRLVVRVSAPALEGRANRAVCRVLAECLGVPPGRLAIVRGERHRDKVIEVSGVEQAAVNAKLGIA
jgi:uncharacterized protein (TIGR00251 family)